MAETREILPARKMTHSLHTVSFGPYVRDHGEGAEAPGGTKTYCMRCGAVEASERFNRGCRKVHLPNDAFEAPRAASRIPRRGGNQPYSADLAEYFDLADWFGGLASTLGGVLDRQRDGGSVLPTYAAEPRLPAYMLRHKSALRQRLTETYRALTALRWDHQVILKSYYSGSGPVESTEALKALHDTFEIRLRAERHCNQRLTGRSRSADTRTGTPGKSPQYLQLLQREANLSESKADAHALYASAAGEFGKLPSGSFAEPWFTDMGPYADADKEGDWQ